ncbi:copper homeostasis protein CutC, partial [Acinetobacter baumannii]
LEVAADVGVDRVELCCALACGGLTPTPAMVKRSKALGLDVMAMVRSKEGGFSYSEAEYRTMRDDAKWLLDAGADGLVFGFL